MADNKRYKQIDDDTLIGYNYLNQKFYITNKDTTTYRATIRDTEDGDTGILTIANILGITSPTLEEDLEHFKEDLETLQTANYTWQDNGAYIHTIQFNDFENNPLTIDCEKAKLYVMNSTVIFDLKVGETYKIHVPILCNYYRKELGLYISEDDMKIFYDLLISFFAPTCYNQIGTPENSTSPLYYNNAFLLSNYDNSSRATYNCLVNPLNTYTNTNINHIININTDTHVVKLADTIDTNILKVNQKVIITGTTYTLNSVDYSADGEYLIQSVDTDNNTITLQEPIPASYQYPYPECAIITSQSTISSINRDNGTITLTAPVPNTIMVGDQIHIEGTAITQEYETISNDGTYTVLSIADNTISIAETFNTNSNTGTLHKEIELPPLLQSEGSTLSLTNSIGHDLSANTKIRVTMSDTFYTYTVADSVTADSTTIPISETIPTKESFTPVYPDLQYPKPYEDILIQVTQSANLDKFPTGDFILDNYNMLNEYIGTAGRSVVRPDKGTGDTTIIDNVGQKVPSTYTITLTEPIIPTKEGTYTDQLVMTCAGLYSEVYKDQVED